MELERTQIIFLLVMALVLYVAPILAALIDLRVALKRVKANGGTVESDKLKETPKKISNYLLFIFTLTVVDVIQMMLVHYLSIFYGWTAVPLLPILTAVASIGCCCIEIKSIYEGYDVKTKKDAREVAKMAMAIVKAKTDLEETGKAVGEYFDSKQQENDLRADGSHYKTRQSDEDIEEGQ